MTTRDHRSMHASRGFSVVNQSSKHVKRASSTIINGPIAARQTSTHSEALVSRMHLE